MKTRTLTDTEVHGVLLNSLHTAAREYDRLAAVEGVEGMTGETVRRLALPFKKQATEARALADLLESAEAIKLENCPLP